MATPTYMVTGYLSMINARNVLEETTSGMLNARPNTINQILPLEAPATARILSVDMVRSATTIEPMARQLAGRLSRRFSSICPTRRTSGTGRKGASDGAATGGGTALRGAAVYSTGALPDRK